MTLYDVVLDTVNDFVDKNYLFRDRRPSSVTRMRKFDQSGSNETILKFFFLDFILHGTKISSAKKTIPKRMTSNVSKLYGTKRVLLVQSGLRWFLFRLGFVQ